MTAEIDSITVQRAYTRWASVYDLVFGAIFAPGRRAAIAAAERVGGRILEVGVGTGISLPNYSPHNRIAVLSSIYPTAKCGWREMKRHFQHMWRVAVVSTICLICAAPKICDADSNIWSNKVHIDWNIQSQINKLFGIKLNNIAHTRLMIISPIGAGSVI